ncbi:TetR/AcrR family transcriptional regulator [Thermoleophilum album]|uniref:Transcriptional regulator, TetR family n=1 Tax=Thermoleophilum album TaxID=29539 RepID=A0A1H6FJ39_THEAL|nr:TetR/AcrR family transcriptional regulator [Thermoleophilum album]SEH10422.1 transcriptional regulator, TetR family [Thermoleophilum album]
MTKITLRADAARNREALIEAAAKAFAEQGLDVPVEEIARRAGVGVGTVYRHFGGKEQLIDAILDQRIGEMAALAEKALAEDDPWQGIVTFVVEGFEMQARDRALKEVLLCASRGGERIAAARERLAPLLRAIVTRAQQAGAVRSDLEPTDLFMLHLMLGAVADFARAEDAQLWRRYVPILLGGLEPGRTGADPLPHPPLDDERFERAMARWHRR